MTEIILSGIKVDEFLEKLAALIDKKLFKEPQLTNNTNQPAFLSRKQVAVLLKISLPTLNDWTKLGWLQSYKIGNRVLYKQNEVEEALHKVSNLKFKKTIL